METTEIILSIVQAMSIPLGVGASTIAIFNFFHAISDGKIDAIERNFMGIAYVILRVAMVLILVTTTLLAIFGYMEYGSAYFSGYEIAQFILVSVLFLNAIFMTMHIMPSSFGPAIQAASWYSLGFIMSLVPHELHNFSLDEFIISYGLFTFTLAIVINWHMVVIRKRQQTSI